MNDKQVAKVAHEATRALDVTNGATPQKPWEELTDQQRDDRVAAINGHLNDEANGHSVEGITDSQTDQDALRTRLHRAIAGAFHSHHKAVQGRAKAAVAPPKPSEPETVQEAVAKADADIAEANAEPAETVNE